jgi:N-acetylmuramoyl-L-alanine amidase
LLTRRLHLIVFLAIVLMGLSPAAEDERLAVYSPQANFTVPVTIHEGHEFVSVTDLLDPFGSVTLMPNGKRWRLKVVTPSHATLDGEFTEGSTEAKLRGKKMTLSNSFWMDNSRGYVPVSSTHTVLSQLLGLSASMRENSRRLFVGDVGTTYTAELQKANPSKLVLRFSAPVNPMVSTEPGRVRLNFKRDPVIVSAGNPQNYDDPAIHSATFAEGNGTAEIAVVTSSPLLATFSDNNRTITLTATAVSAPQAANQPTRTSGQGPTVPATAATTESTPVASAPAAPVPPKFIVIIDPAHGGEDPGAALGEGLFEKDVTLAIARRLRTDLDQRGIMAVMVRDSDTTLSLDQRATAANASRSAVYVSIHAATLGNGVRLYTSRLGNATTSNKRGFLPWDSAQGAYIDLSHSVAASVVTELGSRKLQVTPLESGLRPLRNVAKPAIAVEIAPAEDSPESLTSVGYQQSVASAVAAGIANVRNTVEAAR